MEGPGALFFEPSLKYTECDGLENCQYIRKEKRLRNILKERGVPANIAEGNSLTPKKHLKSLVKELKQTKIIVEKVNSSFSRNKMSRYVRTLLAYTNEELRKKGFLNE